MSMVAPEQMAILASLPQATIGRLNGSILILVQDSSRAGWREIRSALANLDLDVKALRLRQLGWWADGVELWAIEEPS